MRRLALTTVKGGLSRLRLAGGAVRDRLFELTNGYVTMQRTVVSRPGTRRVATLPAGTKGLVHFDGTFHVFASQPVTGLPDGYTLHILRSSDGTALSRIHFAEPYLGRLYVVAEFASQRVFHYWLREIKTWTASTQYALADIVRPTTSNGFSYVPRRNGAPHPKWTPGVERAVGDTVEPTTPNGYYFRLVATSGSAAPRSGLVEPPWSQDPDIAPGRRYRESVDGAVRPEVATPPEDPTKNPEIDTTLNDRYGGGRGSRNHRFYWR